MLFLEAITSVPWKWNNKREENANLVDFTVREENISSSFHLLFAKFHCTVTPINWVRWSDVHLILLSANFLLRMKSRPFVCHDVIELSVYTKWSKFFKVRWFSKAYISHKILWNNKNTCFVSFNQLLCIEVNINTEKILSGIKHTEKYEIIIVPNSKVFFCFYYSLTVLKIILHSKT